jgi:hypothetical protein
MVQRTDLDEELQSRLYRLKVELEALRDGHAGLGPQELLAESIRLNQKFIDLCTEWQANIVCSPIIF